MTHTDFTNAIDRYCQRLVRAGVKPIRVGRTRSVLYDFLHGIERDMASSPTLFEDAGWGVPSGPGCLEHNIASVERMLAPDVVRIRYSVGVDWVGEPAIHLRVLLSDEASGCSCQTGGSVGQARAAATCRLMETSQRVQEKVHVALASSGVKEFPYFNFRSAGERKTMADLGDWGEWE